VASRVLLPPSARLWFTLCLSVCLSVRQQLQAKTTDRIFLKIFRKYIFGYGRYRHILEVIRIWIRIRRFYEGFFSPARYDISLHLIQHTLHSHSADGAAECSATIILGVTFLLTFLLTCIFASMRAVCC